MKISPSNFSELSSLQGYEREEDSFFKSIKLKNGSFKRTGRGRFTRLHDDLGKILGSRLSGIKHVLDVGVSSGITSVELADFLNARNTQAQVTATDLYVKGYVVRMHAAVYVLCDQTGWPLQYEIAGLTLRPWIRKLDYVTLAFIPRFLVRKYVEPRTKEYIERQDAEPVLLVSPSVKSRTDVELVEDDVTVFNRSFEKRFDLVRAANVLNVNNMSRVNLEKAIDNLASYLKGVGGLLLVIRTADDGVHHGTLFELNAERRFSALHRFGDGSDVEKLVLDCRALKGA